MVPWRRRWLQHWWFEIWHLICLTNAQYWQNNDDHAQGNISFQHSYYYFDKFKITSLVSNIESIIFSIILKGSLFNYFIICNALCGNCNANVHWPVRPLLLLAHQSDTEHVALILKVAESVALSFRLGCLHIYNSYHGFIWIWMLPLQDFILDVPLISPCGLLKCIHQSRCPAQEHSNLMAAWVC